MSVPQFLELNHNYDVNEVMGLPDEQMHDIIIWLNGLDTEWDFEGKGFSNWVSNFFITEEHVFVDYYTPGKDDWGYTDVLRYKNEDGTMTLQQNTRAFTR